MAEETVTREQLYEQVWTTPLLRLAVQYGVSNVALGKTCRRLNIPTPGRGYWARLAAGEKLKRPPLPKAKGNEGWIRMVRDPEAKTTEPREKPPTIEVASSLATAHELVSRIATLLVKARVNEHEQLVVGGGVLTVTGATHKRALLLLDALFKELQKRGHRLELRGAEGGQVVLEVSVGEERVRLSMSECLDRRDHVLTPTEQARVAKGDNYRIPKYDYVPGGRLRIDVHDERLARGSWADTAKQRLERKLGHVVVSVEAVAEERKRRRAEEEQKRLEEELRRQREAEERARAKRQQRLAEYRELLTKDLRRMAIEWEKSRRIQEFLDAYEVAMPEERRTDVSRRWLESSRRYASQLDPLGRLEQVARDLELPDESLAKAIAELKGAVGAGTG